MTGWLVAVLALVAGVWVNGLVIGEKTALVHLAAAADGDRMRAEQALAKCQGKRR